MTPRTSGGVQLGEKLPTAGHSRRRGKSNDLAFDPERNLQRRGLAVGAVLATVLLLGIFLMTAGIVAAAPAARSVQAGGIFAVVGPGESEYYGFVVGGVALAVAVWRRRLRR
jgi:hypothetical protein